MVWIDTKSKKRIDALFWLARVARSSGLITSFSHSWDRESLKASFLFWFVGGGGGASVIPCA